MQTNVTDLLKGILSFDGAWQKFRGTFSPIIGDSRDSDTDRIRHPDQRNEPRSRSGRFYLVRRSLVGNNLGKMQP